MIVITTPTGLIGHQVLDNLLDSGEPLRVVAREPSGISRPCPGGRRGDRGFPWRSRRRG